MKRRYQIVGHRAVQSFRRWTREENPKIQMVLPLAEVVSLVQESVGHLLREAGLALMQLVMEEEVRRLAGASVRGENYFLAEIAEGTVGPQHVAPRREFD